MRGVVLRPGRGAVFETDVPEPELTCDDLGHSWALVRVLRAGLCGTDIEMVEGYKGGFEGVFGHEFVGEVVKISGENHGKIHIGQRVVGEINMPCHKCAVCAKGMDTVAARNHCLDRKCLGIWNHGGTFAEFLTLPVANLFAVDDSIPDEIACFAEPVAAACRITEQLEKEFFVGNPLPNAPPQINVAVIGDGKLGLLITAVLLEQLPRIVYDKGGRSKVTLFGRHQDKIDIIASQPWKTEFEAVQSTPEAIAAHESCFDLCVEATSAPAGFAAATHITRPLGTIVLKTTCSPTKTDAGGAEATLATSNQARTALVVKEQRVVGSRCGPFEPAVAFLRDSSSIRAVLSQMLQHVYPLEEFAAAMAKARSKGVLKVQLQVA